MPIDAPRTPSDTATDIASPAGRPPGTSALAARLQLDWDRLRRRPEALEQARSWGVVEVDFDDLDELLAHAGYRRSNDPTAESVLRRLVEVAIDDELAARTVLQRILPGLLAQCRRQRARRFGADALDELIGAAWITIRTFDPSRRPACLAAALIGGSEERAFRNPTRRRSATEVPTDPATTARWADHRETTPSPLDELAALVRDARDAGVTDTDDDELVRGLLRTESPSALAAELGVTARTVRNRRDRVSYRLRRVAVAA